MTISSNVLLQAWREASLHREIQDVLDSLLHLIADHAPATGSVLLTPSGKGPMEISAVSGLGRVSDIPLPNSGPVMEWARVGGISVRGDLTETHPAYGLLSNYPKRAALVCPLRLHGTSLGVLLVVAASGEHFGPGHRQIMEALMEPLATALTNHQRYRELENLQAQAEAGQSALAERLGGRLADSAIVGASGDLREVMERVGLVAGTTLSVLLLGETGSGKEVIARAIHERSERASEPFIRVNCGAIPAELIDSELFGHERGSFTGAVARRQGWFERADGGTLFLDEIGELPAAAQVRLLRVLQEGLLERVGGHEVIRVDVRIVAATHRDLAKMVSNGTFREDLWYRIAGFPIQIPPLRQRLNDIPALAEHMARRSADKLGLPLVLPTARDLQLLASYDWPGNVRELAAVLDRAAILGQGRQLAVVAALGTTPVQNQAIDPVPPQEDTSDVDFPTLDDAVRRHIRAALERTSGRVSGPHGAAVLLGMNANTLRSKMRKLGISTRSAMPPTH